MPCGGAVDSIEAAKQFIGSPSSAPSDILEEIAGCSYCGQWSRIASIYALGFVGDENTAASLRRVAADPRSKG